MGYVSEEIVKHASSLQLTLQTLDRSTVSELLNSANRKLGFAWGFQPADDEVKKIAYRCVRPDLAIASRVEVESSLILLANDEQSVVGFAFESAQDVGALLGECFGFAFVLTVPNVAWTVAFDEHEILQALGPAAVWFKRDEMEDT